MESNGKTKDMPTARDWMSDATNAALIRWMGMRACFVVITGRNTGTGAGIPEKPAETAGVDTAGRYWVILCAFFARLKKPGCQKENRGARPYKN